MHTPIDHEILSFKKDLLEAPLSEVTSRWILNRAPFLFEQGQVDFLKWRHQLAELLDIDPMSIVLIGSASLGFSLNPYKNFRAFRTDSDIDVGIISDFHFTVAWRKLRSMGSEIYNLPRATKNSVDEHREKFIYWGTIATDKILHTLPFASDWSNAMQVMSSTEPTLNRDIKFRIYRDMDSLRAYHKNNLQKIKSDLLSQ